MSRFKIGQRVVALHTHNRFRFEKGKEYTVDGFHCCPKCSNPCIYLLGNSLTCKSGCNCGHDEIGIRECYEESLFAPLQSFGEQIEEQLSKEANEVSDWIIEAIQPKP